LESFSYLSYLYFRFQTQYTTSVLSLKLKNIKNPFV
jgi:hypothetical protein